MVDFNGKPVNQDVLARFRAQRHRGTEGFGLYDHQENNLVRSTTEDGIVKWLKKYPSSDILFHHRTPTSTINVKNACHPFSTGDHFPTNYILIHNGYLNGEDETYREHVRQGITYTSLQTNGTYNDSEVLLWEFARYMEGKVKHPKVYGAVAFICMARSTDGDKIYFYRNSGSPLYFKLDETGLTLASEGEGERVPQDTLFCYNYKTKFLTFKELDISTWRPTPAYSPPQHDYTWNKETQKLEETPKLSGFATPNSLAENGEQAELDLIHEDFDADTDALTFQYNNIAYPITVAGVKMLWPTDSLKEADRWAKAVRKYYNRTLLKAKGNYNVMFSEMDANIKRTANMIDRVKKDKSVKKARQQYWTTCFAQEVLAVNPYFNDKNIEDPGFLAGVPYVQAGA